MIRLVPLLAAALLCLPPAAATAAGNTVARVPSVSTVAAWKGAVERFYFESTPKAERLRTVLPELARYDLQHPDVRAAMTPLRDRLDYQVASMMPGGKNARVGDSASEVERWAVLAGPMKGVLSEPARKRVDAVSKSTALSDRIYQITRALQNGSFGWEDPTPVVAALPKERQQMYNTLYSAKSNSQRVLLKDSRFLDSVSGRVEDLRAEEGKILFVVKGRRLELDDLAIEVEKFVPGDLKKAEAAMTAAGKAMLKQLLDAKASRSLVTVVVAIVLRQDLRATIIDLWAEKGGVHLTLSEPLPGGGNLIRDFAFSEIFGLKP